MSDKALWQKPVGWWTEKEIATVRVQVKTEHDRRLWPAYPFGIPEGPPPDESCRIPLLAKYLVFAQMDHPLDTMVDDIYHEAVRVAKLYVKWSHGKEGSSRLVKCEDLSEAKDLEGREKADFVFCHFAQHPKSSRLDKVVAVEHVVSLEHVDGNLWQNVCPSYFGDRLMGLVLDLLAGGEKT